MASERPVPVSICLQCRSVPMPRQRFRDITEIPRLPPRKQNVSVVVSRALFFGYTVGGPKRAS
jgi:hypothetical protein